MEKGTWLIRDTDYGRKLNVPHFMITVIVAIFLIVAILSSFTIIPTGYTGVRSTFGQINPSVVDPGFTFKIPFVQKVEKVNNKQTDLKFEGKIWSETSERTAIYYENGVVSYSINPEYSAWICANISNYKKSLVSLDIVSSSVKAASKEFNSTDATNRGIIEPRVQEKLQESLDKKYGANVVIIHKITLTNVDFEDTYNNAIAEKQNAQIAYEKQQIQNQRDLEAAEAAAKIKETEAAAAANAKKIEAQANADAKLISANAEAEALLVEASAQAEANEKINASLTAAVLDKIKLDKWDGVLPKYNMGENSSILIDGE